MGGGAFVWLFREEREKNQRVRVFSAEKGRESKWRGHPIEEGVLRDILLERDPRDKNERKKTWGACW